MRHWCSIVAALALLSGCGTVSSWASGCRGLYSGVRHDADLLRAYGEPLPIAEQVPLGADAWLADAWDGATVALDFPFSALGDSLSAPIALAAGPTTPDPVGLGCGWSAPAHAESVALDESAAP